MRPRFAPAAAMVAVMAAILIAAPVAAANPWVTYRQAGSQAFAGDGACTQGRNRTTICSGFNLDVFVGQIRQSGVPTEKGEQVCYEQFSETFSRTGELIDSHGVFGCTFDAGTVTINDLTSITLAPTVIQLTANQCDASGCTETPDGSITVRGTWTGVGPIVSQKDHSKFGDGSCIQVNTDNASFRGATFEGSVAATNAGMGQGTFTFKTNCVF